MLHAIGWPVAWMRLVPFVWVVELGYRLVARNRRALSRWIPDQ
jgi:predicted DCC family thiol-disulfide oxidoreductase YuxK